MQQQDRDALVAFAGDLPAQVLDLGLVERGVNLAVRIQTLVHFVDVRAGDKRFMLLEKKVVGIRPVDAANLVGVAKAPGDQQRGPRPGTLEHGIDCDGGAVKEKRDIGDRGL